MIARHQVFVFVSLLFFLSNVWKFDKKCANSTERSQLPKLLRLTIASAKSKDHVPRRGYLSPVNSIVLEIAAALFFISVTNSRQLPLGRQSVNSCTQLSFWVLGFFLLTVNRYSVNYQQSVGEFSASYQWSICELKAIDGRHKSWPIHWQPIFRLSIDCQPICSSSQLRWTGLGIYSLKFLNISFCLHTFSTENVLQKQCLIKLSLQ